MTHEEELMQAMDELHDAELQLKNARDHHEQIEAQEEVLTCSRIVNRLRQPLSIKK